MAHKKAIKSAKSVFKFVHTRYDKIATIFRTKPAARSAAAGGSFLAISICAIAYMYTRPIPDADIYAADRKAYPGFFARVHDLTSSLSSYYSKAAPEKTSSETKAEMSEADLIAVNPIYQNTLPQPLSPVSAQRYSDAFAALRTKDITAALNEMQMVQDGLLKPDIEHVMKHISSKKSAKEEIYRASPTDKINEAFGTHLKHYTQVRALERQLVYSTNTLKQAGFQHAQSIISHAIYLNSDERAYLFAQLAIHALQYGDDAIADAYARASGATTQNRWGYPIFIQGLLAWRGNNLKQAQTFFNVAANSPIATKSIRVASAFWAARSSNTDRLAYEGWLKRAAQYTDDFYGILAQSILDDLHGADSQFSKGKESQDRASLRMDIELVRHLPKGERLFGLLQIHEEDLAQSLLDSMIAAEHKNVLAVSALQHVGKYAGLVVKGDDSDASTPLSTSREFLKTFVPKGGFKLNPSLIYGVVHVESRFNSRVVSPAGAVGLMQLEPQTAHFITHSEVSTEQLFQPSYNLYVGQRYLSELPGLVGSRDLLHVLAAYNAGPAAVSSWEKRQLAVSNKVKADPFYFLETLPNIETRAYVRHVMAQTWLYAKAMHLPSPSKKALARGSWPLMKDERSGFAHYKDK